MHYPEAAMADHQIPRAAEAVFQHLVDTYASETNKVWAVWRALQPGELDFRPDPKSSSVRDILKHQLLSERRFFAEFLGSAEPAPEHVLPAQDDPGAYAARLVELARPRLGYCASETREWWLTRTQFFDEERERIWIFWRRVLHTAHHRTQLTAYFRVMGKAVPSIYGPTADVTWKGADPTTTVEAAGRKSGETLG